MVLRFFTARHSLSIPSGDTLAFLTPPEGGDLRGNNRIMIGLRTQAGDNVQRYRANSADWGPRIREFAPIGQGSTIAGQRTNWLKHPEFVNKNQIVQIAATQNSGVNELTTADALYIEFGDQELPAALMATVGKGHDMFITGIANNGAMPAGGQVQKIPRVDTPGIYFVKVIIA